MAVSVKDFLDAIRGRFNDEPNKVEVTGSNVVLPIDLQNHNLTDLEPIPTKEVKKGIETKVFADEFDGMREHSNWLLPGGTGGGSSDLLAALENPISYVGGYSKKRILVSNDQDTDVRMELWIYTGGVIEDFDNRGRYRVIIDGIDLPVGITSITSRTEGCEMLDEPISYIIPRLSTTGGSNVPTEGDIKVIMEVSP